MENLTKYVMGVAAKSNVEKRQVGCIIVNPSGNVLAEGYNVEATSKDTAPLHAERMALDALKLVRSSSALPLKALVTHPPCPECAKALMDADIVEIRVVEAFMKFDGDKTRFDLVSGRFMKLITTIDNGEANMDCWLIKHKMWEYNDTKSENALVALIQTASQVAYTGCAKLEEGVAKVLTFGARKYKPNNWKKCTDTGRYLAAAHRHLNAELAGEVNDPETGLPHCDHMMCNLMFLYVLGLQND